MVAIFSCLLQKVATLRVQDCFANMEIEVTFETVYEQFSVSFVSTYILCEFVQKKRIKSDHQFAKENVWKEEKMGNICHMSSLYVRCKGMSVRISVFLSLIVLRFTEK